MGAVSSAGPPVAQWIRATDFGSVGRGFESLRAGHRSNEPVACGASERGRRQARSPSVRRPERPPRSQKSGLCCSAIMLDVASQTASQSSATLLVMPKCVRCPLARLRCAANTLSCWGSVAVLRAIGPSRPFAVRPTARAARSGAAECARVPRLGATRSHDAIWRSGALAPSRLALWPARSRRDSRAASWPGRGSVPPRESDPSFSRLRRRVPLPLSSDHRDRVGRTIGPSFSSSSQGRHRYLTTADAVSSPGWLSNVSSIRRALLKAACAGMSADVPRTTSSRVLAASRIFTSVRRATTSFGITLTVSNLAIRDSMGVISSYRR